MNDATLERLMLIRGPDFPPVARRLADLPDDHPLKVQVVEQQQVAAAMLEEAPAPVEDRLAELEARVVALEGK